MRAPGPLEHSIIVEGLRARPALLVALALLAHAALWTLVPLLADPTPHPTLAIGLALGHEWRIGYLDSPPLAPWLLEIAFTAGGKPAIYALAPLSVALAGWLVFSFAREIVGDRHAALATFLMVGVYPVAYPVGAFDSDVLQMPLVALVVLAWWRAMKTQSRAAFLAFGAAVAALAYAGVQGVFVLATLAGLTIASRTGRAAFATHESLVAAVAALFAFTLLLTPRAIWLVNRGFAGLVTGAGAGWEPGAQEDAAAIAISVALGHVGLLVLLVLASPVAASDRANAPGFLRLQLDRFGRAAAVAIAILPPLLAWATCFVTAARFPVAAAAPLVLYSGLLVIAFMPADLRIHRRQAVGVAALLLLVLPPVLQTATAIAAPWVSRGRATNWPAAAAARYVTDVYPTRTSSPLQTVVGEPSIASQIALASRDRPHVFLDADPLRAPWLDPESLKATGAVVVWEITGANAAPPPALAARLPPLVPEAPLSLPWTRPGRLDPVRLGWAIIPPTR